MKQLRKQERMRQVSTKAERLRQREYRSVLINKATIRGSKKKNETNKTKQIKKHENMRYSPFKPPRTGAYRSSGDGRKRHRRPQGSRGQQVGHSHAPPPEGPSAVRTCRGERGGGLPKGGAHRKRQKNKSSTTRELSRTARTPSRARSRAQKYQMDQSTKCTHAPRAHCNVSTAAPPRLPSSPSPTRLPQPQFLTRFINFPWLLCASVTGTSTGSPRATSLTL